MFLKLVFLKKKTLQAVFFPLPFSNLVATIVVCMFFSGNTMFLVWKILPEPFIASDKELSIVVLFTGPTNYLKHHQKKDHCETQTENCRQQTARQNKK